MIVYKIDVLETLKDAGYNTTRLRKEKLLNESAIQYLRDGKPVGAKALNNICMLLDMQPGNIIKYVELIMEVISYETIDSCTDRRSCRYWS